MVQILKEPIAAKGPRLTCELSLPGRFVVVTPFNDIIAVSRKIHSGEERKRLQKIIEAIKPKNIGVIVRTAAEGKQTAELHEDLIALTGTWNTIQQNLKGATPPTKILSEQGKTTSILRDLLNEDFNKVVINDKNIYADAKAYIQRIAADKADIVSYYNNDSPIFDSYGSYSIGCVEISPSNPNTIWVGTGENNNQRSVAYGDGVYRSLDGGKSFTNMGLKTSEHIGNIIIHPTDENTVWVAAYGPL